jgi:hypothetical protein
LVAKGSGLGLFADTLLSVFDYLSEAFHWLIGAGGLGNVGRNTIITAGSERWDTSARRSFKLTERFQFSFRGEFFNAFNHANEGVPDLNLLDSSFTNFGATRAGGRQVRLFGRLSF